MPAAPAATADSEPKPDEGIPVTSELVREKCSPCHKTDEQGRMTRVSYRRTTPEGWQETLKRMVALNGLKVSAAEAREVLAYLANHHGLAPEEARPAAFEVERRMIDYKYPGDKDTEQTCTKCHSMGRVLSQRRTKEDWELLVAMHRGYYPFSDFQAFRRMGPLQEEPGPDGRPPDNRHPMDKAIEHLAKAFPLTTPEWSAWSATLRAPRLEGRWALAGYQPGYGRVFGEVVIRVAPASVESSASLGAATPGTNGSSGVVQTAPPSGVAEFATTARYVYARDGREVRRQGKALVYTGFQWRGRSSEGPEVATSNESHKPNDMREVMMIDRDWRTASGRWFTGAYDEIGIDVTLQRIGSDPMLTGADQMLKTSVSGQPLRIYGANLPAMATPADFSFGPGIAVSRVVSSTPDMISLEVDVAANAVIGARDVFLTGGSGHASVAVYDRIDLIKVTPQAGLARLGGANFPKQHQQFEAVAYSNGADGKPNTADDITLGLVPATWSIEEYSVTFDDDDRKFVGAIDPATGLFTPALDGPNPKRRGNTNNFGDVWAVASYVPRGAPSGTKPLRARAHLLVTVPLYMKWDQPEVAR